MDFLSTRDEDKLELKIKFAEEYFKCGYDCESAYKKIYGTSDPGVAKIKGKNLLSDYNVRRVLDKLSMEAMSSTLADVPRIITELNTAAFLDPIMLFTEEGDLRPLSAIPEAARRALAGLEINAITDVEGNIIGHNKKIKLRDKEKALRMLGEYQKMFTNKVEVGVSEDMATLILDARKRYLAGKSAPIEAEFKEVEEFTIAEFLE